MPAVVHIMGVDHAFQIATAFFGSPFDPLMDDDVVKYNIEKPITEYPQSYGQQIGVVGRHAAIVEQGNGRKAEDNGKPVVFFEGVPVHGMMGLVPYP